MAKLPMSSVYPKLVKSLILHPQFSHSRCPFGSEAENSVWKQCWLFWKNNCLHIRNPGGKGFVMFWEKGQRGSMKRRECQPTPPPFLSPLDVEFIPTYSQEKHKLMLLWISFHCFYRASMDYIHMSFPINTNELHVCKSVFNKKKYKKNTKTVIHIVHVKIKL